jgi:hypothetical protein
VRPGAVGGHGTTVGVLEQWERQVVAGQRGLADDMDGQGLVADGRQPLGERVQPGHTRLVGEHQQRRPAARVGVNRVGVPSLEASTMSGARSPRPRPAAAVMPTPLGTPPAVGSITNQSNPLKVRELRHRQLGLSWASSTAGSHLPGQGDGAV